MDAMEAILTRRSIRRYTSQAISEETVRKLLKAAMSAPSANNAQPWHFVIIDDREVIAEIPTFHPYSHMLSEAALAILICGNVQNALLSSEGYLIQDCSAATQNLLLAAHAEGLGAVWLGIFPRPERIDGMRKLLELPDYIMPTALISLGYPAEEKPREDRFDPAKVHRNRW